MNYSFLFSVIFHTIILSISIGTITPKNTEHKIKIKLIKDEITQVDIRESKLKMIDSDSPILNDKISGKFLGNENTAPSVLSDGIIIDIEKSLREGSVDSKGTSKLKYYNFYKGMHDLVNDTWQNEFYKVKGEFLKTVDNQIIIKIDRTGRIVSIIYEKKNRLSQLLQTTFDSIVAFDIPPVKLIDNNPYLYIKWGFSIKI